ncbi:MAG TPA: alpha-glucuronidase family glycosyl hydrolase, partial [Allosphingosinicella sp.]|nr:alpha-glucuronidase family glycosyl hydrolase [Allosphingosinicella sp.]
MPDFLRRPVAFAMLLLAMAFPTTSAAAEDGYDLWLCYRPLAPDLHRRYAPRLAQLSVPGSSPTLKAAERELARALDGLLGKRSRTGGLLIAGTPHSSPAVARLSLPLAGLGDEGFLIRSVRLGGRPATVIAANRDIGVLYGAFAFLRLLQTEQPIGALDLREVPKLSLRILNHWDNLDRSVERGYAGASLWDWHKLPGWRDPRYLDYARANASIGINGTVLTNVNANAEVLTPLYLKKVAALADMFRPFGIRVYLTARFSAPIELGKLPTADPLDPQVRAWWKAKADEIYRSIPDFGG